MKSFRVWIGVLCCALALPAAAFVAKQQGSREALRIERPGVAPRSVGLDAGESSPAAAASRDFAERYGGDWRFSMDPRTGRVDRIQGSGIPMIPGRGNDLGDAALAGLELSDGRLTVSALEPRIRAFVAANADLLLPPRGDLELNTKSSMLRDDGRLISFYYDWTVDGIPVEGARVFVRMNSGNVTQLGAARIGAIGLDTTPYVGVDEAVQRLMGYTGDGEVAQLRDPELIIQPEDAFGDKLEYRLVWKLTYRIEGRIETWEGRVDAHSGEIVGFEDTNKYARVQGGVYPRSVFFNDETLAPMPLADVVVDGTTGTSDVSGTYAYGGGSLISGLNGRFFDTICVNCTDPTRPSPTCRPRWATGTWTSASAASTSKATAPRLRPIATRSST